MAIAVATAASTTKVVLKTQQGTVSDCAVLDLKPFFCIPQDGVV
jgi:hypothetical protein